MSIVLDIEIYTLTKYLDGYKHYKIPVQIVVRFEWSDKILTRPHLLVLMSMNIILPLKKKSLDVVGFVNMYMVTSTIVYILIKKIW